MSQLNVPMEFRDLVRTDDLVGEMAEADRSVTKTISTVADVPDPVGAWLGEAVNKWFDIPEIPIARRHTDGVEIEKVNGGTMHFHWRGGELIKTEVFDKSLPGGYAVIEEEQPAYIKTELAKVIGLTEESMHADAGMADYIPNLDY